MKRKLILCAVVMLALMAQPSPAQQPAGTGAADQQHHRELMPVHAKLMEKQKAQDAEIDQLLAEMNSASGEKRIDAMATVIRKLIEQRRDMQEEILKRLDR